MTSGSDNRMPPFNEDAEKAAIGCMLLEPGKVIPLAVNQMRMGADCFYLPMHSLIVEGIFEIHRDRGAVDQIMLEEWFATERPAQRIGIDVVLNGCVEAAITVEHAGHYLDIVRQRYICRRIIEESREIESAAFEEQHGDEFLKKTPGRFLDIIRDVIHIEKNVDVMNRLIGRWRNAKDGGKPAIGLQLPWYGLTEMICGLEPGLTVLAARPSVGKTTIEDQIRCHIAAQGIPVAAVTLDCTRDQLLARAISRKAGVSLPKLKYGFAGEANFQKVIEARDVIEKYPMFINDTDREWQAIATWARMQKKRNDIKLLTLDFLQLVGAEELGSQQFNSVARVSHVSTCCKKLAAELGIPVLVLSQLNRTVEKEGREPKLSDLRDSGAIEQDAEKVIFAYRDEKVCTELEDEEPGATKHIRPTWIDVMKQKDGETGRMPYWLYPPYFRFEEIANPAGFAFRPKVVKETKRDERQSQEQITGLMPGDEL